MRRRSRFPAPGRRSAGTSPGPGAARSNGKGYYPSACNLRSDFPQRYHDEFALPVMRMRDAQLGQIGDTLAVENNVKVDCARTPPVSRYAAQLALELLQGVQQGERLQLRADLGNG